MRPIEKRARPVNTGSEAARSEAFNLPGEFSALLQQVGSPISCVGSSVHLTGLQADASLSRQNFLESYLGEILLPLELPAIVKAWGHGMRGEWRELIAQDHRLEAALSQTSFAGPSRQAGRRQLSRMRPLRDDRMVQRYLAAVESGKAHGWHTVVYGLTLTVYSLPLRQGLIFYAQETLAALAVGAESVRAESPPSAPQDLMERVLAAVSANLGGNAVPEIRLV